VWEGIREGLKGSRRQRNSDKIKQKEEIELVTEEKGKV